MGIDRRLRPLTRTALVAAVVAGTLALTGSAAFAHVTVQPREARQGGFATIAFQVPNERPEASTVRLRVQFPQDKPLAFVSVKPKAGWTYTVEKRRLDQPITAEGGRQITEVVSTITWEGGRIGPGEFDDFPVSVGTLPTDVTELYFPAIQTYDNGENVDWIERPTSGGGEPEHPAPKLTLVPAAGDAAHGGSAGNTGSHGSATSTSRAPAADGSPQAASTPVASSSSSSSENILVGISLALGVLSLVLAIAAIVRAGRTPQTGR
jgi:periplasmic copper chaperone A